MLNSTSEIDQISELLRLMSSQWETAKHCHISLSVLAAKIKQAEASSDSARSQAYATRRPEGSPNIGETLNTREEKRRELGGQSSLPEDHYSRTEETGSEYPAHPAIDPNMDNAGRGQNTMSPQLLYRDEHCGLLETPPSLPMDFQHTDTAHLEGISNFDLNMVDLIHGANFDTLFDLVGQQ